MGKAGAQVTSAPAPVGRLLDKSVRRGASSAHHAETAGASIWLRTLHAVLQTYLGRLPPSHHPGARPTLDAEPVPRSFPRSTRFRQLRGVRQLVPRRTMGRPAAHRWTRCLMTSHRGVTRPITMVRGGWRRWWVGHLHAQLGCPAGRLPPGKITVWVSKATGCVGFGTETVIMGVLPA